MRILAIEGKPTTERGGSERSYFDVLIGLVRRGYKVTLVYEEPGDLLDKYIEYGVDVVTAKLPFLLRKGSRWNDFQDLLNTSKIASTFGPADIIYVNFTQALPLAVLMKLRSGASIVCHIRVVYSGLTRQILWSARFVKKFIVINNKLKTIYEKVFNKKNVTVVYNGIDIPKILPATKTYKPGTEMRLLYLGRIAPEKGVSEMVKAFASAVKQGIKGNLQITGSYVASHSGDYRSELAKLIDESGVKDLIVIGPSRNNPIEYIAGFDLFIFPSIWEEPFGRTIPETILAGTPILGRNVGMVEEIMIDNTEFLFETDDELTAKLIEFYNGTLNFDIETARKTILTKFNKDLMVDGVAKVLQTLNKKG